MVAEEIDVPWERVRVVMGDTGLTVDIGGATAGNGLRQGGLIMRQTAAEARRLLIEMAGKALDMAPADLTVTDGVVHALADPDKRISYAQLIGGRNLDAPVAWNGLAQQLTVKVAAPLKKPSKFKVIGKPMLGTLTPLTGFQGRDMATFLAELVRHPDRYAFSVHENILRSGERVTIFWANNGIFDDRGEVREVLRVGVDMTERKNRLRAAAQELRSMSGMLEGRSWVQRAKLKEITSRIDEISHELERAWLESETGLFESVTPPNH